MKQIPLILVLLVSARLSANVSALVNPEYKYDTTFSMVSETLQVQMSETSSTISGIFHFSYKKDRHTFYSEPTVDDSLDHRQTRAIANRPIFGTEFYLPIYVPSQDSATKDWTTMANIICSLAYIDSSIASVPISRNLKQVFSQVSPNMRLPKIDVPQGSKLVWFKSEIAKDVVESPHSDLALKLSYQQKPIKVDNTIQHIYTAILPAEHRTNPKRYCIRFISPNSCKARIVTDNYYQAKQQNDVIEINPFDSRSNIVKLDCVTAK